MTANEGPSRPELVRGRLFWFIVIGAILLVELAGAFRKWLKEHDIATIPWTTISGMVGHLEELWPTTAVFTVAIIAPAAFYALAAPASERRSRLGRRYFNKAPDKKAPWYVPELALSLSAVVAVFAVLLFDDDFVRAYWIYGALFFFGIVVPTFFVGVLHREIGFTSLFYTIRDVRQHRSWIAWLATVALSGGLSILAIHLAFYPWPDITKESVRHAGLTASKARAKATKKVKAFRVGAAPLAYSTQARGIVGAKDAWLVFFTSSNGSDSGCVVVLTEKTITTTRECEPPADT